MIGDDLKRSWPADASAIELTYTHQQPIIGTDGAEVWNISADNIAPHGDEHSLVHVGDIEIVLLDLDQVDSPRASLRPCRDRLGPAADLLLSQDGASLHAALDTHLRSTGGRILILSWAELSPRWRGFGLGVLLAGIALKHLSAGARAAVCYPMPHLDQVRDDDIDETIAVACMMEVWEQLGFEHAHGGLFTLDLGTDVLDQALAGLRKRLDQPPY